MQQLWEKVENYTRFCLSHHTTKVGNSEDELIPKELPRLLFIAADNFGNVDVQVEAVLAAGLDRLSSLCACEIAAKKSIFALKAAGRWRIRLAHSGPRLCILRRPEAQGANGRTGVGNPEKGGQSTATGARWPNEFPSDCPRLGKHCEVVVVACN